MCLFVSYSKNIHESSCSYRMRCIRESMRVFVVNFIRRRTRECCVRTMAWSILRAFIKSVYPDSSGRVFCVRNAIYFRLVKSGRTPPRERSGRFAILRPHLPIAHYMLPISRTIQIDRNVRSDLERLAPW